MTSIPSTVTKTSSLPTDSEEMELFELLEKQSTMISQSLKPGGRPLSILITGGSQSGKSTLIKAIFGEKIASDVNGQKIATGADSDGKPVTQCVTAYLQTNPPLELIDTPGLERDIKTDRVTQIKKEMIEKNLKPSVIWIVLNYQSSIEDVELKLIDLAPNVPTIVIINKVDFLQKRKKQLNRNYVCLEQFDQLDFDELPDWMKKADGLISRRKRLLNWKASCSQVRRVLILSLGDPDQSDIDEGDDFHEPIGLDVVLGATWGCLDDIGRVQLAELQHNSKLAKTKGSVAIVLAAVASAGGAAWIPLPVVDSIVISSIQTTMIISLYKVWGVVGVDAKTFAIVFVKSLAPVLVTFAVGYTAANVMKFFFGLGSLLGGALDTTIAMSGTLLIGSVVSAYLSQFVYNRHQVMTKEGLQEDIQNFMKSPQFEELVNKIKNVAKNPRNISTNQIVDIIERRT